MAEEQTMMPGNTPEWVKEAEEQMKKEGTLEPQEKKEISIKFGKGLVGEPFTSKRGNQLVEVKIPNQDPADKTPWASFVISPKMIHDNQYGKGVWMKLPEDGTTRVSKPIFIGTRPDGKNVWERDVRDVPNPELKAMMEAYDLEADIFQLDFIDFMQKSRDEGITHKQLPREFKKAQVVAGLNVLAGLDLGLEEILELCAELGSDIPFCAAGQARGNKNLPSAVRQDAMAVSCMRARGRGTEMTPVWGIRTPIVFAKPPLSVSTAEAYRGYDQCTVTRRPDNDQLERDLVKQQY